MVPGPRLRRSFAAGAIAGAVGGLLFAMALQAQQASGLVGFLGIPGGGSWLWIHVLLGSVLGAGYGALVRHEFPFYAAALAGGLLFALLAWILDTLTLRPLLAGRLPTWSSDMAGAHVPTLLGYLLYGGVTGYGTYLVRRIQGTLLGELQDSSDRPVRRVVILGGGFAGVAAARELERAFARDKSVEVVLVSAENYLLFTPMLGGVASSSLEPEHISPPLRALLRWTKVVRAEVQQIDPPRRTIRTRDPLTHEEQTIEYEEVVLALGSVPGYQHVEGAREHALPFRSLPDATALRNRVIGALERADAEPDPDVRTRLLTFVAVGGGYSGVEAIAEIRDTVVNALRYYPDIPEDAPRFVLVHSHERIMEQIEPELAAYAQRMLERRGVEFVLDTYVDAVEPGGVGLDDGTHIPSDTVVWTAGVQPSPLVRQLDCRQNPMGAAATDPELRVREVNHVWAVGDCAEIPDPHTGEPVPNTAQHAERSGAHAGRNVARVLRGEQPRSFTYRSLGMMVPLGHRLAVADIRGVRFSGQLAWFLWRAVYLTKLPGVEKKVRVALDWFLELFFPRDIVLARGPGGGEPTSGANAAEEGSRE